jgi:hypothetical protein
MDFDEDPPTYLDPPVEFVERRLSLFLDLGRLANLFRFAIFRAVLSGERKFGKDAENALTEAEQIVRVLTRSECSAASAALCQLRRQITSRFESESWWHTHEETYHQAAHLRSSSELRELYSRFLNESGEGTSVSPQTPNEDEMFPWADYASGHKSFAEENGVQFIWSSLGRCALEDIRALKRCLAKIMTGKNEYRTFRLGMHFDAAIRPRPKVDELLRDTGADVLPAAERAQHDAFGDAIASKRFNPVFAPTEPKFQPEIWLPRLRKIGACLGLDGFDANPGQWLFVNERHSAVAQMIPKVRQRLAHLSPKRSDESAPPGRQRSRVSVRGYDLLLDDRVVQHSLGNEGLSNAIAMISHLVRVFPLWASSGDITKANGGIRVRFDRVRERLPDPIKNLIKSEQGKGYRLME